MARLTRGRFGVICRLNTGKTSMTGTQISDEGLDNRRRKLKFRSWHRGMRESDLILGAFADAEIGVLSDDEIDQYEALLELTDTEILPWLTGELMPSPAHSVIVAKIISTRQTPQF